MLVHHELFVGAAWYPEVELHHLCKVVGIRREGYHRYPDAIGTNLVGKHASAFTLAAFETSSNKIRGIVFRCVPDTRQLSGIFFLGFGLLLYNHQGQKKFSQGVTQQPRTTTVCGRASETGYRMRESAGCCRDPRKSARMAVPQSQALGACRKSTCPKLLRESRLPTSIKLFCCRWIVQSEAYPSAAIALHGRCFLQARLLHVNSPVARDVVDCYESTTSLATGELTFYRYTVSSQN